MMRQFDYSDDEEVQGFATSTPTQKETTITLGSSQRL